MVAVREQLAAWVLLFATLIAASEAQADTISWTGEGDGASWHDANNWDLVREPVDGDDVVISDVLVAAEVVYSSSTTSIQTLTTWHATARNGNGGER